MTEQRQKGLKDIEQKISLLDEPNQNPKIKITKECVESYSSLLTIDYFPKPHRWHSTSQKIKHELCKTFLNKSINDIGRPDYKNFTGHLPSEYEDFESPMRRLLIDQLRRIEKMERELEQKNKSSIN